MGRHHLLLNPEDDAPTLSAVITASPDLATGPNCAIVIWRVAGEGEDMDSLDLLTVELLVVVVLFVGASRALVYWTAEDKKD